MKAQAKDEAPAAIESAPVNAGDVHKIVFSCDAGMGSSAMGATKFHNRIKAERPELIVTNSSVDNVPADADIVVCQRSLAERARRSATAGTDHHHWQLPCGPESGHPVPDADRCTCRESCGSPKPLTNLPRRIRAL